MNIRPVITLAMVIFCMPKFSLELKILKIILEGDPPPCLIVVCDLNITLTEQCMYSSPCI